jgi:hypothetical protein
MPTLSHHQSNDYTKMILIGDSSSGKTGSLASLVAAGYQLRILDYDNGLESLKQQVLHLCPEKIENVSYRTLQDKRKSSPFGSILADKPRAFIKGIELIDRWKFKEDSGDEIDLGVPAEWGRDVILAIDSLTTQSDAAYDWADPLVPAGKSGMKDDRPVYGMAQEAIRNMLKTICGSDFHCNVIVICHIKWIELAGIQKGYPQSVGKALSPDIPIYFNSMALCQTVGGKRTIQTQATANIDLKNPAPFEMKPSFPLSTGLAEFFATLRPNPAKETKHPEANLPNHPIATPNEIRRFNRR